MTREIEHRVKEAIDRQTDLDARFVWATAEGSVVTLHGSVHTFAQRRHANDAAEATAGVTKVRNHVLVLPTRGCSDPARPLNS